jgi:hypothetical protein
MRRCKRTKAAPTCSGIGSSRNGGASYLELSASLRSEMQGENCTELGLKFSKVGVLDTCNIYQGGC